MDNIKFSLLMSLYDKELPENLHECLYSIYRQTLKPTEIICVFDGPIKKTLSDIICQWQKKLNIIVVKLESNVGLGSALNIGLKHCNYDVVARMDTDDICEERRFEIQIPYFEKNKSICLMGCHIAEFSGNVENISGKRLVPLAYAEIKKFAKKKSPFNHMTVVYRRDIIKSVGGYKDHYFMEDYNLWLRVISSGYYVENLDEILVFARAGENMLARRRGGKYIRSEFQLALLKYKLNIQSLPMSLLWFFLRSTVRILPVNILSKIYKLNRD
ncbi:glycosyltransferase [Citrobacter portucalensis]|nr:glycosyltransferase [Citrobacter portucalensis]MEB1078485.1 glycosyltransferase [Citrobacter portucalensis]